MAGKSIARVGAAAVVLGLSVAGPHAGVAAADSTESESSSTSADKSAGQAGPRAQRPARTSRTARTAPAPAPAPAASVRGKASRPKPAQATDSPAQPRQPNASTARPHTPVDATVDAREAAAPTPAAAPAAAQAGRTTTAPAAASVLPAPQAAYDASSAPVASVSAGRGGCSVCLGAEAPGLGQAVSTVVNHLFNSTFDWLSTLPGGPISDLVTGALVLVRRSLFLIPEGVTASQTTNGLAISVNTGSTAYFRQDGTSLQVSGDPRFWGAAKFTVDAGETVAVSNPGNAGCAGFVFTAGTAPANLATSQIDSIRFEGDAAFTGRVDVAVFGRPLSLRDAVRGLSGVNLDAVVVLENDVEVDAGAGDAIFAGTVDGTKTGKQALTVTALGSTFFVAAVGGTTPLASLLTQGIAPLKVEQTQDSKTIPLHFLPEQSVSPPQDASPGVKYGIDVAIGNNASQIYEFDTGGTGFFAGYNQPFWTNVPLTTTPASEVYNSGNYYDGVVSNTVVTLGQGGQTVSTAQPIAIGAILVGGNSKSGATFDFTDPLGPPVEGQFFGDFGASFGVRNGLTSPLVQLPGNLASGFLVQLGPIGIAPQLTVGVTEGLRAQFPYAIPVIPNPQGGTYPTSGYPILDEFGFAPTYSVTRDGQTEYLGTQPPLNITCATSKPCLPTLIDSGAPTTGIRLGEDSVPYFATPNGKQLLSGTAFTATFPTTEGRPALTWEFVAGDNSSVDQVKYEQTQKTENPENVNVGLTLYNYYDVMFDVVKQTIYLRPTGAQSTVAAGSVTTTGNQTYRQNAELDGTYTTARGGSFSVAGVTTLNGDTTIDTGDGDVTFAGTVDGASSLTINSSGATQFVRVAGSLVKLDALTTNAGGITATAGVTTSGGQSYGDAVSLNGLYAVDNGTFSVAGPATLDGPVSIFGGDIVVNGSIDSAAGRGFQLALTPGDKKTANLNGAIGSTNPLGGLELSAVTNGSAAVNVNSTLALQGNLGYSGEKGIDIGQDVTAAFSDGAVVQNFSGAGVIVGAAGPLTLSGFVISSNGKEGIQLQGSTDVTVTNNVILGNGTDGINIDSVTKASISGNTLSNNGSDGVLVKDSAQVSVVGNTISGSGSDGVEVRKGQGNSILANTITTSYGNGVYLSDANSVTLVDNTISGNGTSASNAAATSGGGMLSANGVYVQDGKDVSITSNTISANGVGALAAQSGSVVTTTYANGIYAVGTTRLTVTGNAITANGTKAQNAGNLNVYADGVFSDNSTPVEITGNTISGNGTDGVEVRVADGNAILSNSIFGNGGKGIALTDSGNADQPAPQINSAVLDGNSLVVSGIVYPVTGYGDEFELQVFYSPSTDAGNVQGQQLLYAESGVATGAFSYPITVPAAVVTGGFITATVTPTSGAANTSKFSDSREIASGSIVL